MKLIYIANLRLPTEKAYGIQIAKMCEAFASEGLDVTLVYPFRKNQADGDIFSYYSVKENFRTKKIWALDFYFFGRLDKIAVNIKGIISALSLFFYAVTQKADIIYSRDEWPLYFLSLFKKNLLFEAHRFSKFRTFFYKRFKNINFKVVVITKYLKEDFIKIGFRPENILVASDGTNLSDFDIDISKQEARVRTSLPVDKSIVMYAGHLFEWKGIDMLLETARNTEIFFVFIGGTERDIKSFKQKAERLNNVLILGYKPHKEIPVYLKAADVLVLPNSAREERSRFYTSPLKLFEYMASKRPIVASDLPSLREVLDESNAILAEPDNCKAFANGIKKVINQSRLAEELAGNAFQKVRNFTWGKRACKIIDFFGKI